jgi:hypothetical protein
MVPISLTFGIGINIYIYVICDAYYIIYYILAKLASFPPLSLTGVDVIKINMHVAYCNILRFL